MKYIIKDWIDNLCFNGIEFDSFEDAWGYVYEKFPNGDDGTFDDYFVVQKNDGCQKCGIVLKPHWLKNGLCNGCKNPSSIVVSMSLTNNEGVQQ